MRKITNETETKSIEPWKIEENTPLKCRQTIEKYVRKIRKTQQCSEQNLSSSKKYQKFLEETNYQNMIMLVNKE